MKQAILNLLPKKAYMTIKRWDYKRSCPKAFEKSQMMRSVETEDGYSYKPFDDNKAIFIHIPKCAGVSVNRTLFGNLAGGHMTLEEYLNVFEPEHIDAYFKFTIVRNPWDRLVSAYFFLKKGGFGDRDRDWFNEELSSFASFDDFVKRWVNEENIWKWHHFRPQYHYMLDKREKVSLDFIGFLENLDEDFAFISQRMGLTVALPKSNKSEHNNYQDYYSEESKEIVKSVYSRDIQMLGYNFDNSALSKQLANRQENCA